MIRRRDLYACATVCAVSFAWSVLVVAYCIGTARRQSALRHDFAALLDRVSALESSRDQKSVDPSPAPSIPPSSDDYPSLFEPRMVARGRSRSGGSHPAIYLWEDWETEPGVTQRRFVARLPLVSESSVADESTTKPHR